MLNSQFEFLKKLGGNSYFVGGAVRDHVMLRTPHDFDIVTDVPFDDIMKRFHTVDIGGVKHGTIQVFDCTRDTKNVTGIPSFEVTMMRGGTIEEDALHRDYTVNCAYMDCKGNVIDPLHAIADISNRVLRMASADSIKEDPIRALRGIRFATSHGFNDIDQATATEINDTIARKRDLIGTAERIHQEFMKAIDAMSFENYQKFLMGTGVLIGALDVIPGVNELLEEKLYGMASYIHDCVLRLSDAGKIMHDTRTAIMLYFTFGILMDSHASISKSMGRLKFSWSEINMVTGLVDDLNTYDDGMTWKGDLPALVDLYRRRGKDEIDRVFPVLTRRPGQSLPCAGVCEFFMDYDDPDFSKLLADAGLLPSAKFGLARHELRRRFYAGDKFMPFSDKFTTIDMTARRVAELYK